MKVGFMIILLVVELEGQIGQWKTSLRSTGFVEFVSALTAPSIERNRRIVESLHVSSLLIGLFGSPPPFTRDV
jgi:hypothetical protein